MNASRQEIRSCSTDHAFVYFYKDDSHKIRYLKDGVYVLQVWFGSSDQSEYEGFQGQARL